MRTWSSSSLSVSLLSEQLSDSYFRFDMPKVSSLFVLVSFEISLLATFSIVYSLFNVTDVVLCSEAISFESILETGCLTVTDSAES